MACYLEILQTGRSRKPDDIQFGYCGRNANSEGVL